jgi:hypothetical protein
MNRRTRRVAMVAAGAVALLASQALGCFTTIGDLRTADAGAGDGPGSDAGGGGQTDGMVDGTANDGADAAAPVGDGAAPPGTFACGTSYCALNVEYCLVSNGIVACKPIPNCPGGDLCKCVCTGASICSSSNGKTFVQCS